MAEVRITGVMPDEPPYDKPEVQVCRDAALIRAALPEGFLDNVLSKALPAFSAANPAWDGAFHLCVSFTDSDTGRLYVFDSLLSDDETDPISHRVKLGALSAAVFAKLRGPMHWKG